LLRPSLLTEHLLPLRHTGEIANIKAGIGLKVIAYSA
jgi:hypothetical protein